MPLMKFDKPYGIKCTELIPSLDNKEDKNRFTNILNSSLQNYIGLCLEHAKVEVSDFALLACEILCDLGVSRGIFVYNKAKDIYEPSEALQTMIAGMMLHDIYIDEEHLTTSLYKAREEFWPIGKDPDNFNGSVMNDQILGQIFQCIEGQFGASTPVEGSIPIVRSPQEDFADAIYIAKCLKYWSR